MTSNIHIQQVDVVDPNAQVCHIDQLETEARHRFPSLVANDTPACVPEVTRAQLAECEYVKFDRYYHVEVVEHGDV